MGPLVSDAKREEEPLTETDIDIDVDAALGSGLETRPGVDPPTSPGAPHTSPAGAAAEPRTIPPPRLRAPTLVGVAPPSLATAPRKVKPPPPTTREDAESGVPRIDVAGVPDEETTTLVGKMLAEAAAQARRKLEENRAPASDTYQDETATKVGDAERLIATANEVFAKAAYDADALEEATVARERSSALFEETTAKRDAINVDGVLARAAELKVQAEAEARRKKAAKKRTFVGLGNGPLTLPAKPQLSDEIETRENVADVSLPNLAARPSADEETLTGVPETPPFALHERKATMPLSGYTEPMPHGPPVRLDTSGGNPVAMPPPYYDHELPPGTPPRGVPPAPFAQRSDPAAFAQTQKAPPPRKKRRGGIMLFCLVLLLAAGAGTAYWQRVPLVAAWERYQTPPIAEPADPAKPSEPAVVPPAAPTTSAAPSASATPAVPASASAEPAPAASASAGAAASASASASPRPAPKPAPKKAPAKRKPATKRAPAPTGKHGF